MTKFEWKCPNCNAPCRKHGTGECVYKEGSAFCEGLVCDDCPHQDEPNQEDHGVFVEYPCTKAWCQHCDWKGTMPNGASPEESMYLEDRVTRLERTVRRLDEFYK